MSGATRRTQHHRGVASGQRGWVFLIIGSLWLSGCIWLCLDQFFTLRGPFGKTPHPWQAPIVLLHGVIAISSMYLLGWISARHVTHSWIRGQRRVSGGVLSAFLTVLIVSGFALFFVSDDQWQHTAAVIHEVCGLALTPIAIQHWFLRQRQRNRSASKAIVIRDSYTPREREGFRKP